MTAKMCADSVNLGTEFFNVVERAIRPPLYFRYELTSLESAKLKGITSVYDVGPISAQQTGKALAVS